MSVETCTHSIDDDKSQTTTLDHSALHCIYRRLHASLSYSPFLIFLTYFLLSALVISCLHFTSTIFSSFHDHFLLFPLLTFFSLLTFCLVFPFFFLNLCSSHYSALRS